MDIARETRPAGLGGFLGEALGSLRDRRIAVPAVLLLLVLTFSNIVILLNIPAEGEPPSLPVILAIVVRLGGLAYAGVALTRVMARSARPTWRLDGAFWLYLLTMLVSLGLVSAVTGLTGSSTEPLDVLLRNIVTTILLAPFAPWVVGIAVAVPLGWNPRRFMRDFRRWLPPLILWSLLIVTPLALAHAMIDIRLIEGVGDLFWPLALFDGALSAVMVLIGLGLNVTAYRHVAPD